VMNNIIFISSIDNKNIFIAFYSNRRKRGKKTSFEN